MYEINFFGWCHAGNSDKVWGYVTTSDNLYNFWGKRGGTFAFQQQAATYRSSKSFENKARAKCRKGYKEIPVDQIDTIWPGFTKEFEHQLLVAKLSDNFRFMTE